MQSLIKKSSILYINPQIFNQNLNIKITAYLGLIIQKSTPFELRKVFPERLFSTTTCSQGI